MIKIMYEDEHIVVIHKPVNMPSQKDFSRTPDMQTVVAEYLGQKPYLIHRLDRHVAGPVVLAKTKEAARELNKQLTNQGFTKTYMAVVKKALDENEIDGIIYLNDYLAKENKVAKVVSEDEYQSLSGDKQKTFKKAQLEFQVKATTNKWYLLEIQLMTGRFHQIRAQLSYHKLPIVGDPKYGIKEGSYIGLQCVKLSFVHPLKKEIIAVNGYHQLGPFKDFEVKNIEFIPY